MNASDRPVGEERRWLDGEVERVLTERRRFEEFERELKQREELLERKEALLREQLALQEKKVRASQTIDQVRFKGPLNMNIYFKIVSLN